MKQKTHIILLEIIHLLKINKEPMTASQIFNKLKDKYNISYMTTNLYIKQIIEQLEITNRGRKYYYFLDARKKVEIKVDGNIKSKTKIILSSVIDLLKKEKRPITCKEITQKLRPDIKIAYRDMNIYLRMIKDELIVSKIGFRFFYRIDKRKLLDLTYKYKM